MKCLVKIKFETGDVKVHDINLMHFLSNPSNKSKKDLPLWRFVTLKDGVPKKANQDYYDTIHMLILEFDHGTTIEAVEEIAKEYSYALHTTSNHTKNDHRFRLMLPLDLDYPESFWRLPDVKQAMVEKFPALDKSCFVNYQCIPALPKNPDDYVYNINKGRKFGYKEIEQRVYFLEIDRKMNKQFEASLKPTRLVGLDGTSEKGRIAYKAKVDLSMESIISALPRTATGDRYSSLISAIGKMLNAKYPDGDHIYEDHEVKQALKSIYWDSAIEKAYNNFRRRR